MPVMSGTEEEKGFLFNQAREKEAGAGGTLAFLSIFTVLVFMKIGFSTQKDFMESSMAAECVRGSTRAVNTAVQRSSVLV